MASKQTDILDSAEDRIRRFGYAGFSFRDVAADVGIKSASVHYHYPTKENLAAAVAARYSNRFFGSIDEASTLSDWVDAFRLALKTDGQLCLCGVLAANRDALPCAVADEARSFFEQAIGRLTDITGDSNRAMQVLATLEGAMILAKSLNDTSAFDSATHGLISRDA